MKTSFGDLISQSSSRTTFFHSWKSRFVQLEDTCESEPRDTFCRGFKISCCHGSKIPAPLESSVNEFIADQENKNTRAKTERDVKLLKAFLTVKGESRKPDELTPQEPNEYLSEFILSVKRKDSEDYEPSSLRGLIASFNRHFKEQKYPGSIIEGAEFEQTRKCLEARSKQLKKQRKGNKPNAAQALTDDEVNILFEQNLLGISSAEALSNKLWFFNTVHFGLITEHIFRICGRLFHSVVILSIKLLKGKISVWIKQTNYSMGSAFVRYSRTRLFVFTKLTRSRLARSFRENKQTRA